MQQHQEKERNDSKEIDEQRWQAVCNRDQVWDGIFVFAVCTTGVYCRPSCTSRRANRENVSFHDTPAQAQAAGYRACKRCKPNQVESSSHGKAIAQACRSIELAEEKLDLAALAASAGLSPSHFQRVFKSQVGLSPKQYAVAVRKQRFRDELKSSKTVTQTIYEAGYDSPSRAYADNATPGLMPSKYKKGAPGEKIRYAHRETSLGSILVAATDRGICLVEFVEKEEALSVLRAHFPSAELQEDATDWKEWISEVVAQIDDPHRRQSNDTALPLDIRGTVFQEKVWRALTEIPSGKTLSYTQLAQSLGQPNAARAVARACASNRLAVLVPCHRVIRESGDLAGYKWGLERKQQLLEQEAKD